MTLYDGQSVSFVRNNDGKITHFVVGVGTGGTISGVGKFLKEKKFLFLFLYYSKQMDLDEV